MRDIHVGRARRYILIAFVWVSYVMFIRALKGKWVCILKNMTLNTAGGSVCDTLC